MKSIHWEDGNQFCKNQDALLKLGLIDRIEAVFRCKECDECVHKGTSKFTKWVEIGNLTSCRKLRGSSCGIRNKKDAIGTCSRCYKCDYCVVMRVTKELKHYLLSGENEIEDSENGLSIIPAKFAGQFRPRDIFVLKND